ncbi:hypothetical protein SP18gp108 [Shigella phage SP18]|uniref:Uncharacterized protein n=1 Tax=Shigella phage SP18 TaxID=645664 RepID=E3SFJ7_BPSP8|nr:hypothetical protein SP18_gp108 [Shigella phage SP18]ADO19450.1 hypothetical protein SP18gp108 [Shigella phage SP18]
MVYKVWTYISILIFLVLVFVPMQQDQERYEREVEIVASTYHSFNKECPNKNGISLQQAYYLSTVTSPKQRVWVERNFAGLFSEYCFNFKRL